MPRHERDTLLEIVKLLEAAPPEFKNRAGKALKEVLDEYEDWISLGRPSLERFRVMQMVRGEDKYSYQKIVRRWLRDNPED